jgi:hypothetical protein
VIPVRVPASMMPVLASERRFNVQPDHPLYEVLCPVCDGLLGETVTVLVFAGIAPEDRKDAGWTTGGAVAVHAFCAGVPAEAPEKPPRTVTFDLSDSDTLHVLTQALEDYAANARHTAGLDDGSEPSASDSFARWAHLAKRLKRQAEAAAG